jgi:hypothetical protein
MPKMVLFRTTLSSDLPVSRQMDTIAAGSVLRSHGLYPYLAINRLYTLILGQPPRYLSLSPEQLTIEAPVVVVVEAKNENMKQGINQCIAEMVAAQLFNQERHNTMETVYGVVTTGSAWKFLRLVETVVYIDRAEYYIKEVERIVGILVAMIQAAKSPQSQPHAA